MVKKSTTRRSERFAMMLSRNEMALLKSMAVAEGVSAADIMRGLLRLSALNPQRGDHVRRKR
jgi:hypothetical protein